MVCHGDKGQGLAVFRYSYPKNDQNCSSTKCHGGPYPPAGFGFPDAPAIIGNATLGRYRTAADLYAFVSTRMPYQAPAELSSQEYWNVVAYLLRERGAIAPDAEVDAANANAIPVQPRALPGWAGFAAAGGVALIAGTAVWLYRTRRARS